MPTYEYQAIDVNRSCKECFSCLEVMHSILIDFLSVCPNCNSPIKKLISEGGGVIIKHREANQYSDIKKAKYWRDKNGVRHRVQPGDGHSGSPTVKKQTASPGEIRARKKIDRKETKQDRLELQDYRAKNSIKTPKHPED